MVDDGMRKDDKFHWLTRLPPPVRRLIIGCVILFVGWLGFLQILPRTMPAFAPPMQTIPAPKPANPAPVPEKPVTLPIEVHKAAAEPPIAAPVPIAAPLTPPQEKPSPTNLESLQAKVAEQSNAIAALQKQQEHALQTIALLDAYDRLKERVYSGRPYTDEFTRLRTLSNNSLTLNKPLKALEDHAGCGIVPLESLTRDFPLAARRALRPASQDGSMMDYLAANLSDIVAIRRVGDVSGDTSEAIIARAEADLERNHVQNAIEELSTLKEPALSAMKPWIQQATAYAARDGALADLRTAILSQ